MKTYVGVEVQLHTLLTSALDEGEWSALRPCRFTREESPQYPLHRRLAGPQSQSGRGGEVKKILPLPLLAVQTCRPARSLVSILTELPRLLFVYKWLIGSLSMLSKGTGEQVRVSLTCDLLSEDTRFVSWPSYQLSWLRVLIIKNVSLI
jgi:hypothetical protein